MRDWIRRYLGTDILPRMETTMSEITDALSRLAEQTNAVSAAQATSFSNLQNAISELKAGNLDEQQRALVAQIEGSLTKLGEDAQRADDGFEPAEVQQPDTDPADSPATDGTVPGDGTAPVEDPNTGR